jgi:hypothetical protein
VRRVADIGDGGAAGTGGGAAAIGVGRDSEAQRRR